MSTRPSFAAIIGHSDSPEMLDRCIRHHLGIGVDHVFVSANVEGGGLPDFHNDPRVRVMQAQAFTGTEPFRYLSHAVREVEQWVNPDWVLFTDSDEFWLPKSGRIAETGQLGDSDLFIVERFNVATLRGADGAYVPPDLANLPDQPLVAARETIDDAYLSGDTDVPWIMALDAPKLLVRTAVIERVETGGHAIVARNPRLRWHMPDDLLIAHVPFTDEARFRRKVAQVREVLSTHKERFDSRQAWHWRHWAGLSDAEISSEFRRQSFRVSALPILRRQRVLATAPELYPELQAQADQYQGDALQELLGRTISNYVRPGAEPPPPPPAAAEAPATVFAPERRGLRVEDCYWYHSMDVPGHGQVVGQWDLRGQEATYLGNVPLSGKRVLEIGPASGYLTFWMEQQGAQVTSFDLDEHQKWDIVPFGGLDHNALIAHRAGHVRQINNSWWLLHERLRSRARAVYGNIYELDKIRETFDVVTLNSVMLHLRDPVQAMALAAARSHRQLVITDVAETQHLPAGVAASPDPVMYFLPKKVNHGPIDTWWIVSQALVIELLKVLGFTNISVSHHTQRFLPSQDCLFYTVIATK